MALKIIEKEVIADNAINAAKVEDGTIVAADLAANTITNADVKSDAAIAASKIAGLATSATTDTTNASNIATGTLPIARLDTGTTANKIVILDGNAKLPAISGASLTGIVSATVSTSDPVIATNPSGGVGTKWINKTSGEVYVCTDATAGSNIWTNVGAGSGNIDPWSFPASTYGYVLGGGWPSTTPQNYIQKYSTVSDANAVDWADLTVARISPTSGQRSIDYGYCSGGSPAPIKNTIDKFPFASQTNSVDVGDLSIQRGACTGASSGTYCYAAGGYDGTIPSVVIDKFPVASDTNATDVGDLLTHVSNGYGSSSSTHGYRSGGYDASPSPAGNSNVIQKWSFSADANSTDVGDLTTAREGRVSESSLTHGYCGNDYYTSTKLDKFTFASDANATNVGNLAGSNTRGQGGGASSIDNGYFATGWNMNYIMKFSHSSDGNGTDVADLAITLTDCSGTHG